MRSQRSFTERVWISTLVVLDAFAYAFVLTITATAGAIVLGVASGGGFLRAKYALFLFGFVAMAYATFLLWPSSPSDLEETTLTNTTSDLSQGRGGETRFQKFVQAVPPVRWLPTPPHRRRATPPAKLFLASLVVLLVSYSMEVVFDIA